MAHTTGNRLSEVGQCTYLEVSTAAAVHPGAAHQRLYCWTSLMGDLVDTCAGLLLGWFQGVLSICAVGLLLASVLLAWLEAMSTGVSLNCMSAGSSIVHVKHAARYVQAVVQWGSCSSCVACMVMVCLCCLDLADTEPMPNAVCSQWSLTPCCRMHAVAVYPPTMWWGLCCATPLSP